MTDFKPGDVALNPHGGVSVFVTGCTFHAISADHWHHAGPDATNGWDRPGLPGMRRVVVLDPESTVDVDRICKALVEQMHRAGDVASAANGVHPATVAAALREFAAPAPVKPPEPTGLGAVVVDADGTKWVLADPGDRDPWKRTPPVPSRPWWLAYADITAVTVLSEGAPS